MTKLLPLLLLLLLVGCSAEAESDPAVSDETASGDESEDPDSEPSDAPEDASGPADAALLTLDDVPSGWAPANVGAASAGGRMCDAAEESDHDPAHEADVAFSGGTSGPFAIHIVALYDTTSDAESVLADMSDQVQACGAYTEGTTEVVLEPLSVDNPGDETFAYRQRADDGRLEAVYDIVAVRSGSAVSVLALGQESDPPDSGTLSQLVETAAGRL